MFGIQIKYASWGTGPLAIDFMVRKDTKDTKDLSIICDGGVFMMKENTYPELFGLDQDASDEWTQIDLEKYVKAIDGELSSATFLLTWWAFAEGYSAGSYPKRY